MAKRLTRAFHTTERRKPAAQTTAHPRSRPTARRQGTNRPHKGVAYAPYTAGLFICCVGSLLWVTDEVACDAGGIGVRAMPLHLLWHATLAFGLPQMLLYLTVIEYEDPTSGFLAVELRLLPLEQRGDAWIPARVKRAYFWLLPGVAAVRAPSDDDAAMPALGGESDFHAAMPLGGESDAVAVGVPPARVNWPWMSHLKWERRVPQLATLPSMVLDTIRSSMGSRSSQQAGRDVEQEPAPSPPPRARPSTASCAPRARLVDPRSRSQSASVHRLPLSAVSVLETADDDADDDAVRMLQRA